MIIDNRYRGFPQFAHGGYVGGLIAVTLDVPAAEVRFKKPIPLDVELDIAAMPGGRIELRSGETVHAVGVPAGVAIDIPTEPSVAEACAAAESFIGHDKHLVPACFVCGPDRHAGDGLRIFPGTFGSEGAVAGIWTPHTHDADEHGHVRTELVWASLDCAQLWGLIHAAPSGSTDRVVTGSLATRVERPVVAGQPHIVMGWPIARDGRMIIAGGAVIGPDGWLCALSRQTAITTSWGIALGTDHWRSSRPDHRLAAAA